MSVLTIIWQSVGCISCFSGAWNSRFQLTRLVKTVADTLLDRSGYSGSALLAIHFTALRPLRLEARRFVSTHARCHRRESSWLSMWGCNNFRSIGRSFPCLYWWWFACSSCMKAWTSLWWAPSTYPVERISNVFKWAHHIHTFHSHHVFWNCKLHSLHVPRSHTVLFFFREALECWCCTQFCLWRQLLQDVLQN